MSDFKTYETGRITMKGKQLLTIVLALGLLLTLAVGPG